MQRAIRKHYRGIMVHFLGAKRVIGFDKFPYFNSQSLTSRSAVGGIYSLLTLNVFQNTEYNLNNLNLPERTFITFLYCSWFPYVCPVIKLPFVRELKPTVAYFCILVLGFS